MAGRFSISQTSAPSRAAAKAAEAPAGPPPRHQDVRGGLAGHAADLAKRVTKASINPRFRSVLWSYRPAYASMPLPRS